MNEGKNERIYCGILGFIALFLSSSFLYNYLYISISKLPLMDYWKGSAEYLESVMTEGISLDKIFPIPHVLHWNPFYAFVDYFFVRIFKCDNRAYVYTGMLICFFILFFVIKYYFRFLKVDIIVCDVLGLFVCILPVINLNQWEILTLSCIFPFMCRIFVYLVLFYCIDIYLKDSLASVNVTKTIIIGFTGIAVILLISQAYFPGYVMAILSMLFFDFIINSNKRFWKRYLFLILCNLSGVIIYFLTLVKQDSLTNASNNNVSIVEKYVKGILLMLGATILPITKQSSDLLNCYCIGAFIFIVTILALFFYFKYKLYKKTYFPVACLIYSFVNIIVIIYGRTDLFGLQTLTSSRYVVETTIGLLGLVQILWMVLVHSNGKMLSKIFASSFLALLLIGFVWCDKVEIGIGPYRKIYDENMIKLALDIDNASDEELSIFQAPADDVRNGISVMKKYHLSLWAD